MQNSVMTFRVTLVILEAFSAKNKKQGIFKILIILLILNSSEKKIRAFEGHWLKKEPPFMFVSCKIIPTMKSPLLGYTFFFNHITCGKTYEWEQTLYKAIRKFHGSCMRCTNILHNAHQHSFFAVMTLRMCGNGTAKAKLGIFFYYLTAKNFFIT